MLIKKSPTLAFLVKQRTAEFLRYKDGNLWYFIPFCSPIENLPPAMQAAQDSGRVHYSISDGFEFPIPIADAEGGTFEAEERPLILMRWIRKHYEFLKKARDEQEIQD